MIDLREAIVRHLDDDPDPHKVAKAVCDEVGPHDVRAVMEQLMPDAVRKMMQQERMAHRTARLGSGVNGKRDVGEFTRDPLRMVLYVAGERKRWGECTAEDCYWLAADRRGTAKSLLAVADEFEEWGDRLEAEGVETIADLSDLGGAVAA